MPAKPSYEELERRVQALEKLESDHNHSKKALQESERLFKILYENSPFGYQSLDENGRFIVVNQTWLDILGYTREEVIGKSFTEFLHPDWRDHFKENFPRFKSIGEILGVEFEMVKKNGDLILVSFNGKIGRDQDGRFLHTHCILDEITERRRAEKQLKESEEKFKTLIQQSPFVVEIYDPNGLQISVNKAYEDLWDFPAETTLNKFNVLESKEVEETGLLEYVKRAYAGDSVDVPEYFFDPSGDTEAKGVGRRRWLNTRIYPLKDESGKVKNVVIVHQDITERKQAAEALRASEARFRHLFQSVPNIAVQGYGPDGTTRYWNEASEHLYGYTAQEAIGRNLIDLIIPTEMRGEVEQAIQQMAETGQQIPASEMSLMRKDGSRVSVFSSHATLQIPGQAPELFCMDIDITEQKRAEEEKERLEAQLHQAQKMESVGRLAGGVAHDFNNMLSVILGHTEMALEDVDPAVPIYASLQAINYAAERSAALTRQLLAFARKQTIAPKVIDINKTVEGMLNMLRRLIGENIDLLWQPGRNLQPVKVDPAQIDQLLANLCVNARDAITGVGKITIETDTKIFDEAYCADHLGSLPGEYVLLEVSDDGCGMDKKTLNRIFEPFFTTKEQGKGTGLGLASVFGMVKQNNGFINVYSEPDQGTTFKIYIPAYAVKSSSVAAEAPDLPAELGNEIILLVEDEPAILEMTTRMLTRLGYTVVAAATPGEAIRLALEYHGKINLLMTDVVMPEMNGRELAGNLLSHYPALKRLFMSGYTANIIAHHGVLDDGVHFIQKPFSKKDLGRKLREALED